LKIIGANTLKAKQQHLHFDVTGKFVMGKSESGRQGFS
jgi:hypothetical protein